MGIWVAHPPDSLICQGSTRSDVPSASEPLLDDASYKWRAFTAIAIAFVTNVASMSMVFVALSAIADDFGVTLGAVAWVMIIQALVLSAMILPMGRLADIIGRRRVHLTGLVLFGGGALLVAFAPTFGMLIAARAVMAVGNAMGQSVAGAAASNGSWTLAPASGADSCWSVVDPIDERMVRKLAARRTTQPNLCGLL